MSKRVREYDAECSIANNVIGSSATVTGSEPVYKNIKLKETKNKQIYYRASASIWNFRG